MKIERCTLGDGDVSVTILSLGAITQSWQVAGIQTVLGYADPSSYLAHPGSLGVIVGRVANRIGGARFDLGGQTHRLVPNEGSNQLHGGPQGWQTRNWRLDPDGDKAVRLSLHSPDGDMGFPGSVDAEVIIRLDGHCLTYDMTATPDRVTPVAMANHNYYNLDGKGTIWGHRLQVSAERYTPTNAAMIPTGTLAGVAGSLYDFRTPTLLSDAAPEQEIIDINYALDQTSEPACLLSSRSGLTLRLWTDQPGLQVYSGHVLRPKARPLGEQTHEPCTGLAIEAQGFPNAVNIPTFPSVLCSPDRPYRQTTRIEISPA